MHILSNSRKAHLIIIVGLVIFITLVIVDSSTKAGPERPPRAGNEFFENPGIPSGELLVYIYKRELGNSKRYLGDLKNSQLVVTESILTTKEDFEGIPAYVVTHKQRLNGGTKMEIKYVMRDAKNLEILQLAMAESKDNGSIITSNKTDMQLYFAALPPDTVHMATFPFFFRTLDFEAEEKKHVFNLGADRSFVFRVYVTVKDKEDITTPAGTFECYKAELIPNFVDIIPYKILAKMIGRFFPPYKLWYSVEEPHYMVQAEGVPGMPGTPKQLVQLVKHKIKPVDAKVASSAESPVDPSQQVNGNME